MKRKNKLFFTCILVFAVCILLAPSAFAAGEETDFVEQETVAVDTAIEPVAEAAEPAAESAVAAEEGEAVKAEETLEELPAIREEATVEETESAEVVETEEEAAPAEEAAEAENVEAEETSPTEEAVETETVETEEEAAPVEEESVPEVSEEIDDSELQGNDNEVCYSAIFYGLNDSVATLKGGEEMNLNELISSLGYKGEIESAESSKPEALEIADGKIRILNPFGDETITLVIGGQEVTIKVHDPTGKIVNAENIIDGFNNGGTYYLISDVTVNNGTLIIPAGKDVTLDLNGKVLRGTGSGSVITVSGSGKFTLKDSSTEKTGTITGGNATNGGGIFTEGTFIMDGGNIVGNTATDTSSAGGGGGVRVSSGTFTMKRGSIVDNTASGNGGGVNVYKGTFNMEGGSIVDNTAVTSGGGVFLAYSGYYTAILNVSNGEIIGNRVSNGRGGGVFAGSYSQMTMTGGEIAYNYANDTNAREQGGGGVMTNGSFKMTGGSIHHNATTSGEGAGVYSYQTNRGPRVLGGSAKIINNVKGGTIVKVGTDYSLTGGTDSNFFVAKNGTAYTLVSLNTPVTDGENKMNIGVAMTGDTGVFTNTTATSTDYLKCFTPDKDGVSVFHRGDNTLWLLTDWGALGNELAAAEPKTMQKMNGDTRTSLFTVTGTGATNDPYKITLGQDFKAITGDITLVVSGTKTLDLNGHVINGKISNSASVGSVIKVSANATLTLEDGSQKKTGTITGGTGTVSVNNTQYDGGGVYVVKGGTFNMNGGTITGNTAGVESDPNKRGGGGGVHNGGTFNMTGGTISNNTIGTSGGGVYNTGIFNMSGGTISGNRGEYTGAVLNADGATFNMGGGTISDNSAKIHVGGVGNSGTFTMTGGTISGNTAGEDGGGVYIMAGTFTMTSGKISSNTAATNGGGVFFGGGSMTVGGDAKISGNTSNNLYLPSGKTVTVSTDVTPTELMSIGVTLQSGTGNVTGTNTDDYKDNFTSDNKDYTVINRNNVVQLCLPVNAPTAKSNLVYSGTEQTGVEAETGAKYTLSNNTGKNADNYTATATLADGYYCWSDGTTEAKSINWTIAQKEVSLTWTAPADLVYSKSAKTPTVVAEGLISGDSCDVTAALTAGKDNVNVGKFTFTASALSDSNYTLPANVTSAEYEITPKLLSVTGTTVKDKFFDGTTDATVSVGTVSGVIEGDVVTIFAKGAFDTAEVGKDKTVTVVYSTDNSNYKISPESEEFKASISEKPVPTPGAAIKVYVDGELLTEKIDYNWVNGKVVLTSEFVATLEAGEHTLTIEFPGYTVNEDFSIIDGIVVPAEDAKYLAVKID